MAKKITAKTGDLAVQNGSIQPYTAPDFMQEDANLGIEDLGQFIRPPRLKVVQKSSDSPFDEYDNGTVIAVPHMIVIAGMDDRDNGMPFSIVPLFTYAEWLTVNPFKLRNSLPYIRDRSLDINSTIARKSRNPNHRYEPCPEDPTVNIRHVECINFIVLLTENEIFSSTPVVMSFSKGSISSGSNFAALITLRKGGPIFGNQFVCKVSHCTNNPNGSYHLINVMNPPENSGVSPFVEDKDLYTHLKETHLELAAAHKQSKILVDYDDPEEMPEVVDVSNTSF